MLDVWINKRKLWDILKKEHAKEVEPGNMKQR
jgi:hypothetical protein